MKVTGNEWLPDFQSPSSRSQPFKNLLPGSAGLCPIRHLNAVKSGGTIRFNSDLRQKSLVDESNKTLTFNGISPDFPNGFGDSGSMGFWRSFSRARNQTIMRVFTGRRINS